MYVFRILWRRHLVSLFLLAVIVNFCALLYILIALGVYCNMCYCYRVLNFWYLK